MYGVRRGQVKVSQMEFDLVAGPLDAPFQQISHPEFAANLFRIVFAGANRGSKPCINSAPHVRIGGMFVISRDSAFTYKGRPVVRSSVIPSAKCC
jgi:hypothetical protein